MLTFSVTESWLNPSGDVAKCADLAPPGYKTLSFPRFSRGGGIAFVVRDSLCPRVTINTDFPFQRSPFELVHVNVALRQRCLQLFCLYRPHPNKKNQLTDSLFFQEFPNLLEHCNSMKGSLLVAGDFNI